MFARPTIARPIIPMRRSKPKRADSWEAWFRSVKPGLKGFGRHHKEAGLWLQRIKGGMRPSPGVDCWPRGHGKSTFGELGSAYLGDTGRRSFVLYICDTQDSADRHVQAIQSLLESLGGRIGTRLESKYGHSKGWKPSRIRTASGFNVIALGLDVAMRGIKLDDMRPDLIIFDDIDGRHDTLGTTKKKVEIITESILPARAAHGGAWFLQNLIIPNGIVSQLCDGRADFLADRIVRGPIKAVNNLRTEKQYLKKWKGEKVERFVQVILSGEPTWEGCDLTVCQSEIIELGWKSFDREKQQNVKDVEGALWTTDQLNACRVRIGAKTDYQNGVIKLDDITRTVVAVDPATTSKDSSNETGIVALSRTADGHGIVREDASGTYKPSVWGRRVVLLHDRLEADCVVAEKNQGGEMVEEIIVNAAKALHEEGLRPTAGIQVKLVHASKRKRARAEPVEERYSEGMMHHLGDLEKLEMEMTTWNATDGSESPNRIDATVWGAFELGLVRNNQAVAYGSTSTREGM